MANIVRYSSPAVQRREDRVVGRALARIDTRTDIGIAEVDSKLQIQEAKAQGVITMTAGAARGAAQLGQLENQLQEMIPGSAAKVGFLIDRGILALGDVLDDTVTELRRLR